MPSGDRTGPMGQGPMTGRASGYCAGYDTPGFTKGFGGGMGRGFGFGRGRGMGYGRGPRSGWNFAGYYPEFPWSPALRKEDEIKMLKAQVESLQRLQKDLEHRLGELEKEDE